MPKGNEQIDFEIELARLKANAPAIISLFDVLAPQYVMFAKQYKRFFDALVAEGFKPEEALELVKTYGIIPK